MPATLYAEPRWPRRLLLAAPSGGLAVALTVQITTLSWLLQHRYGLAIDAMAFVWAAGPLAGIFGQLAVGHASDRTWWLGGRRRPYLLFSGLATAAALLALLQLDRVAAALGNLPLVIVAGLVALVLDLAINLGLNPARALVADMVPSGRARSLAFSMLQLLSGGLGVAITLVGARFGNEAMVLVAAILALPLVALPAFAVREPRALQCGESGSGPASPKPRGDYGPLGRILLAQALSWIGFYAMFVFLAPVAAERLPEASAETLGRVLALALGLFNLVAALAPLVLLMPLAARWRRAPVHAGAMLLTAAFFAGVANVVETPMGLWLCMALAGIGWGSLVTLPYALFCDRVDPQRLGLMLGVFNLAVVIPQLIVSLGLGAIAPVLPSRAALFEIAAVALVLSAMVWSSLPPVTDGSENRNH